MYRAVFLDRDGTLNAMVYNTEFGLVDSPSTPDDFRLLPHVGEAVQKCKDMGFLTVVVSNQPGIAKGKFSPALLDAMTEKMMSELATTNAQIDAVYYCYHHPEGVVKEYQMHCDCRKPKPGLFLKAASDLNIDLGNSYLIGDGITDIQAGQAAGTKTILLYPSLRCYICEELSRRRVQPDHIASHLLQASELIYKLENGRSEN
jgi:D-glycero-D-manno-heptose 1,7-bisphosphate phosphatase